MHRKQKDNVVVWTQESKHGYSDVTSIDVSMDDEDMLYI